MVFGLVSAMIVFESAFAVIRDWSTEHVARYESDWTADTDKPANLCSLRSSREFTIYWRETFCIDLSFAEM